MINSYDQQKTFNSFGFQILWSLAYPMKVILETRGIHLTTCLHFYVYIYIYIYIYITNQNIRNNP